MQKEVLALQLRDTALHHFTAVHSITKRCTVNLTLPFHTVKPQVKVSLGTTRSVCKTVENLTYRNFRAMITDFE
jgi:hypothetical protein